DSTAHRKTSHALFQHPGDRLAGRSCRLPRPEGRGVVDGESALDEYLGSRLRATEGDPMKGAAPAERSAIGPVPVNSPLLDGRERELLIECIEAGWISSEGPFVARFEEAFARRVGRRFGVAVANGSGALDVALKALGFAPGDEVVMPSFTIISPAASILRAGAT